MVESHKIVSKSKANISLAYTGFRIEPFCTVISKGNERIYGWLRRAVYPSSQTAYLLAADDAAPRGVRTALPSPPPPARLCSHSQLRLSGQPPARSIIATLCSGPGLGARIQPRSPACSERCLRSCLFDLSHLRGTDARDRETYCYPAPTPLSTFSARVCRMNAQFQPRPIPVLRHPPDFSVSCLSSQVVLTHRLSRSQRAPRPKPDPVFNRPTSSHSATGLPHLLSHLNAIQIP